MTKLIIQIPCYNEQGTIANTLADIPRVIDGVDELEILLSMTARRMTLPGLDSKTARLT